MYATLSIQLQQVLDVFRIDAPVIAIRLPRVHRVVAILIALNPDRSFGKKVNATDVVPVRMADHDVCNLFRPHSGGSESLIGLQIIAHRELAEVIGPMKAAVEENSAAAAANQPEDHCDIDSLALRRTNYEFRKLHIRRGAVANRIDRILG